MHPSRRICCSESEKLLVKKHPMKRRRGHARADDSAGSIKYSADTSIQRGPPMVVGAVRRKLVLEAMKRRIKSLRDKDSRLHLRFRPDRISESSVRLVDVVFAVIIGQSLVLVRDKIVSPDLSLGTGSLVLVYLTIILSWVGYHLSIMTYPYNKTVWSRTRAGMDIFILILYAYLIFVALDFHRVLVGLAAVFLLYVITGFVRQREWNDVKVSQPWLSLSAAIIILILLFLEMDYPSDSVLLLCFSFATLLGYWILRFLLGYQLFVVGVDVDGVLASQIEPVLDLLRAQGLANGLAEDDITDWHFKIDGKDIAKEIERALLDDKFVESIDVRPGADKALGEIYKRYHVVIATARPVKSQAATIAWLEKHFKHRYHEYANTALVSKSKLGLDVLIDDNPETAKEFADSEGLAILFDQPWNRSLHIDEDAPIGNLKLFRRRGWEEVKTLLDRLADLHPRGESTKSPQDRSLSD